MESAAPECTSGCFADSGTAESSADGGAHVGNDATEAPGYVANPLCGDLQACIPDDTQAVACYSDEPAGGDAGPASDAGAEDAGSPEGGNMGGSADAGGWFGESPTLDMACQVTFDGAERSTVCVPAGGGKEMEPCQMSSDCAAGFACVGNQSNGVCRPYCCQGLAQCKEGTYCAIRQLRDILLTSPAANADVPVCMPGDCLFDSPDSCPTGLACVIVRGDGTTACMKPGTAIDGEPCDCNAEGYCACAEGLVCSRTTNTCMTLCNTTSAAADNQCSGGSCQGGFTGLPADYGVCVGTR